jgi:hypothetical protein
MHMMCIVLLIERVFVLIDISLFCFQAASFILLQDDTQGRGHAFTNHHDDFIR